MTAWMPWCSTSHTKTALTRFEPQTNYFVGLFLGFLCRCYCLSVGMWGVNCRWMSIETITVPNMINEWSMRREYELKCQHCMEKKLMYDVETLKSNSKPDNVCSRNIYETHSPAKSHNTGFVGNACMYLWGYATQRLCHRHPTKL